MSGSDPNGIHQAVVEETPPAPEPTMEPVYDKAPAATEVPEVPVLDPAPTEVGGRTLIAA